MIAYSSTSSDSVKPRQSFMSSDHLLAGLPGGRSPSTTLTCSVNVFTSRSSFIRKMRPNIASASSALSGTYVPLSNAFLLFPYNNLVPNSALPTHRRKSFVTSHLKLGKVQQPPFLWEKNKLHQRVNQPTMTLTINQLLHRKSQSHKRLLYRSTLVSLRFRRLATLLLGVVSRASHYVGCQRNYLGTALRQVKIIILTYLFSLFKRPAGFLVQRRRLLCHHFLHLVTFP